MQYQQHNHEQQQLIHQQQQLQLQQQQDQHHQQQQQAQQLQLQQQQQQVQQQQVPFGSLNLAQPGSLSYGFGLSPASNFTTGWKNNSSPVASGSNSNGFGTSSSSNTTAGFGFGSILKNNNTTNSSQPLSQLNSNSSNSTPNNRRRRRSVSPGDGQDEREYSNSSPNNYSTNKSPFDAKRFVETLRNSDAIKERSMKRVRVLEDVKAPVKDGIDLGKALASLPKESLLTILTSLLTTSPSLASTIQSLLPPPTLSQTLLTLTTLERSVLNALPTSNSFSTTRDDYIYSRIRVQLEEYITECKTFLNQFCSPNTLPSTSSSSTSGEDEIGHPSTTFQLLYSLASSLRRLELALPSPPPSSTTTTLANQAPLSIHLLPLLINSFHIFLTKLSNSVNQEGKILSASILRNWFDRLDELCVASPGITTTSTAPTSTLSGRREGMAKKALEGVRDRMRKEVGWLIGLKEVSTASYGGGDVGMEEEL